MPNKIIKISIVYGVGQDPYIFINYEDINNANADLKEQIGLSELPAYIARFTAQQFAIGKFVSFSKGTYTLNNVAFDAIVLDRSDNPIPPPGLATKNIVLYNGSNIGTVEIKEFSGLPYTLITGAGYNSVKPAIAPLASLQAVRGDIDTTPANGTGTLTLDVSGLSSTTDLVIYVFGESFTATPYPLDNGTDQPFTFPFNVSYGGSLFILVVAGGQPTGVQPSPPARSGALRVLTTKSNYSVVSIDAVKLPHSGITFPVSNAIQDGTWNMNTAVTIDFDYDATIPLLGNAFATLYINNIAVDTQVLSSGSGLTCTFVNVPIAIPNGQPVRIEVYGD